MDLDTGRVTYRTAWGQMLEACGHSYLPDWDDEPYDVLTQTRPHPPDDRAREDDVGENDVADEDPPTYWDVYDVRPPPAEPEPGPVDTGGPGPARPVDPEDDVPPF